MKIQIKGTPEEIKKLLAIGQDNQQLDAKKLYKHMTNDLAIREIMKEPISPYHFRSFDDMDDLIKAISAVDITAGRIESDSLHLPKQA